MPSLIYKSESSHFPILFSPSFAMLGTHDCLTCPPFSLSSSLVFRVLLLLLYLALSVNYTPFSFSPWVFFLQRVLLCFSVLFYSHRWRGVKEEIHVGSTSGLHMCSCNWSALYRQMGFIYHSTMCVVIRGSSSHLGFKEASPSWLS